MLLLWYTPPPAAFSIYVPAAKPGGYTLEEEDEILALAYYFGWIE